MHGADVSVERRRGFLAVSAGRRAGFLAVRQYRVVVSAERRTGFLAAGPRDEVR